MPLAQETTRADEIRSQVSTTLAQRPNAGCTHAGLRLCGHDVQAGHATLFWAVHSDMVRGRCVMKC